jgi:hypothetical protein
MVLEVRPFSSLSIPAFEAATGDAKSTGGHIRFGGMGRQCCTAIGAVERDKRYHVSSLSLPEMSLPEIIFITFCPCADQAGNNCKFRLRSNFPPLFLKAE